MIPNKVDYFDHDADMGIIGRGEGLEEAFCSAAKAVFQIMADIQEVSPSHQITIHFVEEDNELAFVTWINLLLAKARELGMIFSKFELKHDGADWFGYAYGEKWQEGFARGTEVKGATLTMLKVIKNDYWEARCVVDV